MGQNPKKDLHPDLLNDGLIQTDAGGWLLHFSDAILSISNSLMPGIIEDWLISTSSLDACKHKNTSTLDTGPSLVPSIYSSGYWIVRVHFPSLLTD